MQLFPRWSIWAFAAGALAFFAGLAADVPWLRVATKPIPVVVLAVVVLSGRTRLRVPMGIGLLFGAVGDLLLEVGQFIPGLVAFLVGHLWYIGGLLGVDRRPRLLLAAPFAVWAIALPWWLAEGAGDLLVPIAIYAVVLCAAMWRAGALLLIEFPRPAALALFVGFVTFGVSDSLIAIDRFGSADIDAWSRWAIMATYWLAQSLIAWGTMAAGQTRSSSSSNIAIS